MNLQGNVFKTRDGFEVCYTKVWNQQILCFSIRNLVASSSSKNSQVLWCGKQHSALEYYWQKLYSGKTMLIVEVVSLMQLIVAVSATNAAKEIP